MRLLWQWNIRHSPLCLPLPTLCTVSDKNFHQFSDLRTLFRNLFLLLDVSKSYVSDVYLQILSQQGFHLSSHYALLWSPNCLLTAPLAADEAQDGRRKIPISQQNLRKQRPTARTHRHNKHEAGKTMHASIIRRYFLLCDNLHMVHLLLWSWPFDIRRAV